MANFPAPINPGIITAYADRMIYPGNSNIWYDVLGNASKEDALLKWHKDNCILGIDLYEAVQFGRNTATDSTVLSTSDTNALAKFIVKARTLYGIISVSFVGNPWYTSDSIGIVDGSIPYRRAMAYNQSRINPLELLDWGNVECEWWNFDLSTIQILGPTNVNVTAGSDTVFGSGAGFQFIGGALKVNNWILINGELRQITAIPTNSTIYVDRPFLNTASNVAYKYGWQGNLQVNGDGDQYRVDYDTFKYRAESIRRYLLSQAGHNSYKWQCYLGHPQGNQYTQIRDIAQYFDRLLPHCFSSPTPRYDYFRQRLIQGAAANKTGNVSQIGTTIISGIGTRFTTELYPQCKIEVRGEVRTVVSISSDSTLSVDTPFTGTWATQLYGLYVEVQPIISVESSFLGPFMTGSGGNFLPPTYTKAYKYIVESGYGGAVAGPGYPAQSTPAFNDETNTNVRNRINITGLYIFDQSIARQLSPQPSACAVVCGIPGTLTFSSITQTSVVISWASSTGATAYNLQYRVAGTTTWTSVPNLTGNTYTLNGLTSGQTYEFQLQSICSGGTSLFSNTSTVTTSTGGTCGTPTGLSVSTVNATSVVLNWTAVLSAVSYNIRYKPTSSTTWVLATSTTNSLAISGLIGGTQYEFEVQANCCTTSLIPAFDHIIIVIGENTNASTVLGSASFPYINGLANASYGCGFNQSYAITHPSQPNYITLFSGSTQGVSNDNCPPSGQPYSTNNLFKALQSIGKTYAAYSESLGTAGSSACSVGGGNGYWRKHAPWTNFNNFGSHAAVELDWTSFPNSANYASLPHVSFIIPNQVHDDHNGLGHFDPWLQTNIDPLVQWARTHNSLVIITYDEDDFTPLNQISTVFAGANITPGMYSTHINHYSVLRTILDSMGASSAGMAGALAASPITNVWNSVGGGCSGLFSGVITFTTSGNTCPVTTGLVVTNITSTTATLNWNTALGVFYWGVEYRKVGDPTWIGVQLPSGILSLDLAFLDPCSTYEFHIQTNCGSGNLSAFTSTVNFATLCCIPPANLVVTGITNTSALLSWSAVGGASSYEVQYRVVGAGSWTTVPVTATFLQLTSLTQNTNYEYQIRTVCGINNSSTYTSSTFTTTASICPVITGLNVTGISLSTATLNWTANGFNYNVRWREVGTTTWNTFSTPANSGTVIGLLSGVQYEFQVQSDCGSGNLSAWTGSTLWTTLSCPVVSGLNVTNIAAYTATLNWSSGAGAASYNVRWRIIGQPVWQTQTVTAPTTTLNITGLSSGYQYEFQVQTNCGSTASTFTNSTTWTSGPPLSVVINLVSGILCNGGTGSLSSTVGGGLPGYTYEWIDQNGNTISTTSSISGLIQGTYSLIVTDANASVEIVTYTLLEPAILNFNVTFNSTTNGLNNGTIDFINTTGGTLPYYYHVNGLIQSIPNFVGLAPSTYTVFVSDANGCTSASQQIIIAASYLPLSVDITLITDPSAHGICDGQLSALAVGGLGPFIYTWSNGYVGQTTLGNLCGDVCYTVTVTDANNNTATDTYCLVDPPSSCALVTGLNVTNIGLNDAILNWDNVGTTYNLRYRIVGTLTWNSINTLITNSYHLIGLTDNTQYEFEVQNVCLNDVSSWTDPTDFTTTRSYANQVDTYRVVLCGKSTLYGFTDIIVGETADKYYVKEFQYAIDGVAFSPLATLTNAALQAITIDETDLIILDFTYTRAGTDVTGLLSLTSIDVLSASNGSFNSRGYEFDHSNFAKFLEYCDTCVTGWSANVLEKLYDRSQIAAYLERGLTEDISNDLDFIKFWKTVTTFFAFYVCLARQFTVFYTNQEFLAEFLKQRGLIFCNDETFESLTFFLHHYYDEIRKRGTIKIIGNFDNSDISNSTSTSYQLIDGELLRSICKGACDDFIFNYRKKNKVGFNLRNSSPNYRGTSDMEGCNKIWTRLLNITDYLQYPLFSSVQGAFSSVIDSNADGYPIINIGPLYGVDYAGIGLSNVTAPSTVYAKQYGIVVDPNIDYEFNFRIEITGQPHFPFLSVGCNAFDCDGNAIDLLEPKFLNISYNFVEFIGLNKASKYYFFRGIIYSKNKFLDHDETNSYNKHDVVRHSGNFYIAIRPAPVGVLINQTYYWQLLDTDEIDSLFKTNWSQGNNLQFTSDVRMIIPFIKIQATDFISQVKVWNARVQPVATRYSAGFLDTNNWIDFWLKNRNLDYTYDQLKELFRRYLLPYDVVFEFNKLLKDEAILGLPINTHGHINGVPVIVEQENRDIILGIKRCSVIEVNDPDAGPYIPFHAAHPDNYGYHSMQRNLGLQAGESTPFSEMYEILSFKIDGVDIITNSVKIYLNQNNLAVTTGLNGSIQVTNITQMVNSLTRSDILYFFDDMAVFYSSCTTFEIRIAFEHEMSFDNQVHRQYYKYTQDAYYWSAVVDQEVYAVGADYRCHLVDDSGSAS